MCSVVKISESKVDEGKEGDGGGVFCREVASPKASGGGGQVIENSHGAYIIHNEETAMKAPSGSGLRAIRAMRRKS